MAFKKEKKSDMVATYEEWIKRSSAVFMLEYNHMSMKAIDELRSKAREAGGEVHITKNTLLRRAMDKAGIKDVKGLEGTTICGFAFNDAPSLAKVLSDSTKNSEIFKVKGGYLNGQPINALQVKALADLPPLPVMRSKLLGVINAPASKLVRTLAEPGRQVASVLKAYSEKDAAPVAG